MQMEERENKMACLCVEIMQNCRNELYHYFPYLDGAFASILYKGEPGWGSIGTDGEAFYYGYEELLKEFGGHPSQMAHGYLHMLLHCLYLHIFPPEETDQRSWDLACDLAVELVIARENIRELQRAKSPEYIRLIRKFAGKTYSAGQLYEMLQKGEWKEETEILERLLAFDSHERWYHTNGNGERKRTRQKWEKVLAYTGAQKQERRQKAGSRKGSEKEELEKERKSRCDYRRFLKQFAVPREEVELDLESFDYIFYDLGMEQYGDMPLIEPLEYREVNRLEELVIAIDTSGSCSREVVQQFLAETYGMLSSRENFFRKMKVYLIQCDCFIQDVMVIHSEEEWEACSRNIQIQGRGGTDFRPVFEDVESLRRKKELKNLKALIYFTDGDGIYPREKTQYETAFVFLKEKAKTEMVPAWARKLFA